MGFSLALPRLRCRVHVMSVNAARVARTCARRGRHARTLYLTCSLVACVARSPSLPEGGGALCRHNNAPKYACNPFDHPLPSFKWPFLTRASWPRLHPQACAAPLSSRQRLPSERGCHALCTCALLRVLGCLQLPGSWHEQRSVDSVALPFLGVWLGCIEPRCPLAWGPSTSTAPFLLDTLSNYLSFSVVSWFSL